MFNDAEEAAHKNYLIKSRFENPENDPAKELAIVNSINLTLHKLLRQSAGYVNDRDSEAVKCLLKDLTKYVATSPSTFSLLLRLHKKQKNIDEGDEA